MKTGSYKELKAQIEHCKSGKRDMETVIDILEYHKIVVKAVEARLEFFIRRLKELDKSMERLRKECKPHNWIKTDSEGNMLIISKCTKCGITKKI